MTITLKTINGIIIIAIDFNVILLKETKSLQFKGNL